MKKKDQVKILAAALYAAARDKKQPELEKVVSNFGLYLKARELMSLLPEILSELERIYFEDKNIVAAEVISKNKLSDHQLAEIAGLVQNKTGKSARVKQVENEELIGGAAIRHDDKLLDLSLKNQLISLKKQLAN
ncbi:ATP synthase F1 subunit delta [Candidatus Kuenenbacteria bacterium CG_4_9_14_3_um_filter_39_14]|uniref:ATP synthase subunit delta n=7 Tax=Candidatus Kueneniibacteriota TaxID=1752740 RepID=A0A2M7IKX0_9BACT|nr:ATP synthase F1 subunit delta [Candidatus Kuenenbacteria bacterium]OIP56699.1 MAG: ATP synthase F1 subunit delta [Candidatus Kuenenbacteria bacterium CG2_30_39_24]PIP28700.1 MAG: ATP synthase F1 subunit delta [Candidatus Kuenenbacteria bacterium CG23_combo_of_CG06-09_8_20_14_all_39_39]PIP75532.1 MAG: ATP synthase F1 subunit delta [Candidatus Kuenenbacteria bacterium CG22_combo_CG10-13_8_21_14_all_39_9]PIR80510.1 MAG: ATP synthase F1 subunit delta [Candidatus Kuenenbacteria bacterium CG10_big